MRSREFATSVVVDVFEACFKGKGGHLAKWILSNPFGVWFDLKNRPSALFVRRATVTQPTRSFGVEWCMEV